MRIIELKGNYARLTDREPFLLPQKLEIGFKHVGYDLSNAFITFQNGSVKEKYKLTNPMTVDNKFLFTGRLFSKIEMYLKGEKVKEWDCLPIEIKETEEATIVFDVLSGLEERLDEIEKNYVPIEKFNDLLSKYNVLVEKHNTLTETVKEIKENY